MAGLLTGLRAAEYGWAQEGLASPSLLVAGLVSPYGGWCQLIPLADSALAPGPVVGPHPANIVFIHEYKKNATASFTSHVSSCRNCQNEQNCQNPEIRINLVHFHAQEMYSEGGKRVGKNCANAMHATEHVITRTSGMHMQAVYSFIQCG